MKIKIAPSILSADFGKLADEIRAAEQAGADWIHIDVMDGRFVPNITIGPLVVEAARKTTELPLDVHLMIVEPERHVEAFAKAGADYLVVHDEATTHLHRTLQMIRDLGVKPGVSYNPATPLGSLPPVIDLVDVILLMSVNPGFGGQTFIPAVLPKVAEARALVEGTGREIHVEVDGGVGPSTAAEVKRAGADVLVAGSAVFCTQDYAASIRAIREAQ